MAEMAAEAAAEVAAAAASPAPGCLTLEWSKAAAIWSPVGSTLALACAAGLEVFEVPTVRLVGRKPPNWRAVAFRADGQALAVVTDRGLQTWNLASGVLSPLTAVKVEGAAFSLSPDWRRVAVADAHGVVSIFDVASASVVATLAVAPPPSDAQFAPDPAGLSWSPDGARVATAADRVQIWDAATGSALGAWKLPAGETPRRAPPQWTADGATVFFLGEREYPNLPLIHAGDARTFKRRGAWPATNFTVSRDGKTLFTSGEVSRVSRINLATGATREIFHLSEPGAPYIYGDLALSPDGRWLTTLMGMMGGAHFDAFDTSLPGIATWRSPEPR
jgi:WD40 repeat protein